MQISKSSYSGNQDTYNTNLKNYEDKCKKINLHIKLPENVSKIGYVLCI